MRRPSNEQKHAMLKEGWELQWQAVVEEEPHAGQQQGPVSLSRLKVPGGWLCRTYHHEMSPTPGPGGHRDFSVAVALAFVPEPPPKP